jgi:hypothetical protein
MVVQARGDCVTNTMNTDEVTRKKNTRSPIGSPREFFKRECFSWVVAVADTVPPLSLAGEGKARRPQPG